VTELKEQWKTMTEDQRQEYAEKHHRAICPYCGEEVETNDKGQLFSLHIREDWTSGRTQKFRELKENW
jgi:hypothetical protein